MLAYTAAFAQQPPEGWRDARDENGVLRYRRLVEALGDQGSLARPATSPDDVFWSDEFTGTGANAFNAAVHAVVAPSISNGDNDVIVGGAFTTIGKDAVNRVARWDGQKWVPLGSGANNGTNGIVLTLAVSGTNIYVGGQFTRAGGLPANNVAVFSLSTLQWNTLGQGVSANQFGYVTSITAKGSNVYVGGYFSTAGSGVVANNIAMWNTTARTWSALGSGSSNGVSGEVSGLALDNAGVLYAGGSFLKADTVSVKNIARWNGTSWSGLGKGVNGYVNTVMFDSAYNRVYAGGSFNKAGTATAWNIAKWDINALRWDSLGVRYVDTVVGIEDAGVRGVVRAIAIVGVELYVGGTFTTANPHDFETTPVSVNFIARWTSARASDTASLSVAWGSLGIGAFNGVNGHVNALATRGNTLYVGGQFTSAGKETANRIARWQDNKWSVFGSSADGSVYSMALINGRIYVGGTFRDPNNGSPVYVARWEDRWITINKSVNGKVYAVAAVGTDLIVGGQFTAVGGINAINIARYNSLTDTWSAITNSGGVAGSPNGVSYVSSLAVRGTDLIVGGQFAIADSTKVNNIAMWSQATGMWSALGSGMNETVLTVTVGQNGDIYAGGRFTNAGGVQASRVARYNGTAWSALGAGVNGDVTSLAARDKELFVGGLFTASGADSMKYIARYDAVAGSWSTLGKGIANTFAPLINTIAVTGKNVFVGGNFNKAGDADVSNIAMWDDSVRTWSALGSGVGNIVRSIVISADSVYVGGDFTSAGEKPSFYVGLWTKPRSVIRPADGDDDRSITLQSAWPQPARESTTINFTLSAPALLRLSVWDLMGREVAMLAQGQFPAGSHQALWPVGNLPDGVYLCRLQRDGAIQTLKIVLSRGN